MKKYLFLALAILLVSWTFISCGDEDEESVAVRPLGKPIDAPNCPVAVNPTVMPKEGLIIIYNLYNSDGKQTNVFKYGEDIIFNIEFRNLTDTIIYVAGERDSAPRLFPTPVWDGRDMQSGIFNVHSKDGKFIGYPYLPSLTLPITREGNYRTLIYPQNDALYGGVDGGIVRWVKGWLGNPISVTFDYGLIRRSYGYAFGDDCNNLPLPVGEYYSEFNINIGKGVTYPIRMEFVVEK